MNKRIKKKRNNKKLVGFTLYKSVPWNTNTPHWKRCKASGRKYMWYYHNGCICNMNRNNRVYQYSYE